MRRLVLLLALSLPAAAQAPAGEPQDLRLSVGSGAVVNWTSLQVEATHQELGTGVSGGQRGIEQISRQIIGVAIEDGVPDVAVRSDLAVRDLLRDPAIGGALENRLRNWAVSEAHYHASGKVALYAGLDLAEYLRPWSISQSVAPPAMPTVSSYSGLVIEARDTSATPAFVPRVLADDGAVLWDGRLWSDAAITQAPAVWVLDPSHPAAARAGKDPLVVQAARAQGADLTLDREGSQALRTHLVGAPALGEGRVVVIVAR